MPGNKKIPKIVSKTDRKATPVKQAAIPIAKDTPFETFLKKNALLVFTGAMMLLIFIVFYKFLILRDTYLFTDIGSDSVNQVWPYRVQLSEYIRHWGFPKWSFNEGTGKNMYPLLNVLSDPFNVLLSLFPKDIIPYGTIYIEILKIYWGGLFFFLFLRTLKMPAFTSITGGLLFAFSGFMIIGSSYVFSAETLFAAITLYSSEKFIRYGTWYLMPIPFLLFAAMQPFLLYFYVLLATVYSTIRIIADEGWQWKKLIVTTVKIGALAFLGVIMCSFIFLSNVDLLLHTTRSIGGETSAFKTLMAVPIFGAASMLEITTSMYSFFSSDLLGTGDNFTGWRYYIESPILYTGLLTCLLLPQSFFLKTNPKSAIMETRKKRIYIGLFIVTVIPLFFPFFRYFFWLFTGNYYRTYALFLSMLFLIFCVKALSAIESNAKINAPVLFITLAILLVLLFYPFYTSKVITDSFTGITMPRVVNNSLRAAVAFFLILYTCILYFFNNPSLKKNVIPLLGITILIELASFSYISVNRRLVVSSDELHEKVGYNDYTIDALAYINARDASFFRINKNYGSSPSIKWNAPYNDAVMQNFKGTASYDSFNQINYCNFLNELHVWYVDFRKLDPYETRTILCDILNEKYVLLKKPFKISALYDSLTTIGNVTITKNRFYLPFGFTYQNYISLSEFRKLDNFQKDKMLFQACVIDSGELPAVKGMHQLFAKDTISQHYIDLNELSKFTNSLRKDSLSNVFYNQNTVKGAIKLSQQKLLFLSIPYDKGWAFKLDGSIVKPLMANIGFMGVVLNPGEHTIKLNYEPPYLKLGCYISGFSVLGYLFLLVRFRRKRF